MPLACRILDTFQLNFSRLDVCLTHRQAFKSVTREDRNQVEPVFELDSKGISLPLREGVPSWDNHNRSQISGM